MYEVVVIGNPEFSTFPSSQGEPFRTLSGPAAYGIKTLLEMNHRHTAIVGSIGEDFQDEYRQILSRLGNPEHFIIDSEATGGFEYSQRDNGELQVNRCLGVASKIGVKDIPEEFLSSKVVVLSPMLQEIDDEFIQWVCDTSDAKVVLDPHMYRLGRNGNLEVIDGFEAFDKTDCYLDLVQVTKNEAEMFTGVADDSVSAELIVESIADSCLITSGNGYSLFYDGDEFLTIPSFETEAVDHLGSGPVHLAAFVSGMLNDRTHAQCLSMASAAASIKTEQQGLMFSLSMNRLLERAELLKESVQFR